MHIIQCTGTEFLWKGKPSLRHEILRNKIQVRRNSKYTFIRWQRVCTEPPPLICKGWGRVSSPTLTNDLLLFLNGADKSGTSCSVQHSQPPATSSSHCSHHCPSPDTNLYTTFPRFFNIPSFHIKYQRNFPIKYQKPQARATSCAWMLTHSHSYLQLEKEESGGKGREPGGFWPGTLKLWLVRNKGLNSVNIWT